MSWTACYNDTCQRHQSDKEDSEWYLKSLRKNLHKTQVKRCIDSLYSKSNSEESYEVIKLSSTEKKLLWDKSDYTQQDNHYLSDISQEDFSQEELKEVKDIIKTIDDQVTIKMFKSEWEYPAELWKSAYTDVFNILKTSLRLVSYREEILQIWQQMTLLVIKTQVAAFLKKVYEECYRIFREQVAQSDSLFAKRV